jgi:hypothetical protein
VSIGVPIHPNVDADFIHHAWSMRYIMFDLDFNKHPVADPNPVSGRPTEDCRRRKYLDSEGHRFRLKP